MSSFESHVDQVALQGYAGGSRRDPVALRSVKLCVFHSHCVFLDPDPVRGDLAMEDPPDPS